MAEWTESRGRSIGSGYYSANSSSSAGRSTSVNVVFFQLQFKAMSLIQDACW